MKRHTFPNIFDPKIGFTYHVGHSTELWDAAYHANSWVISDKCGWFDTYGDGMIQHSLEMICGPVFFVEWCLSFSHYCMEHIKQFEPGEISTCGEGLSHEQAAFLLSVKHSPEKRRWFSTNERKVSTTTSKQYDTRWMQVPDWADGSVDSAIDLHWKARNVRGNELFDRLPVIESVKETIRRITGSYYSSKREDEIDKMLRLEAKHGTHWSNAYQAYQSTMNMMRSHEWLMRTLESTARYINEEDQAAAPAPATTEAVTA